MGTTTKRHKLVAEQLERPCEDRISNLPSSLIGYILSFLPTKDAVATSVLSSRWKDFWPLVTRLSIDDYLLRSPESKNSFERLRFEFVDFVHRVLLTGSVSGIETFRFQCSQRYDASSVRAWLSSALKGNNVREVDVIVDAWDFSVLPSSLFTCRTLVKLNLGKVFMNVPDSVWLPCLKHVELHGVEFPNDDSISRLLSGCPVLGSLCLKRCMGRNVRVINISVPTLTHLILEFLHHYSLYIISKHLPKFHIVLNTPSLLHISIEDSIHESYVFEKPHQLAGACFILYSPLGPNLLPVFPSEGPKLSSASPFEDVHHIAIHDLLKGSSKVKSLHFVTKGFNRCELMPKYENLTELVFGTHWNVTLDLLHTFLERSPKLSRLALTFNHKDDETLNFSKTGDDDGGGGSLEWDHPSRRVPDCLLFHLKIVEIWNFRGLKKEIELVKYLLRNGRALEKVTVERAPIRGETSKDVWAWQRKGPGLGVVRE